ncbi:hypothetical protein [Nocardia miyunensis]|uniref:hypothetical protein n=1 Tax=Nocardia miyunensis TaxID=282684 RepID=UPI0008355220|nr:hypothetical protein [Nocardia miyunensis]
MSEKSRTNSPATESDESDQFDALAVRAARAGYRLVQNWPSSHHWHLLDRADDELLHAAPTLEAIETWLDT